MKKTVSMLVALALIIGVLGACSSGNKESQPPSAEASSAAPSAKSSESASSAPAEPYELKVLASGTDTPGLEELAKQYESEHQGAKITVDRVKDPGQYTTLLQTQLATNDAPDIFFMWPGLSVRDIYVKGNYVEDLSDLSIVKKIGDGLKQPYTYDGKTYAIPYTYYFLGMFYNKTIFEEAGLNVPTNWDEFVAACEALKQMNVTPFAINVKDFPNWYWFTASAPLVYAQDPDWDTKRYAGEVTFADSPGWKKAAARLKELYDKKYVEEDSLGVTYDQTRSLVISGKAAIYIDGNWALPPIKEAADKAGITMGAFIAPFNDAGQPELGSASPSNGPGIWTGSKYKEEAKQFLEYLYADENVQKYIGEGNIPTNPDVKGAPDPIIADIIAQNAKEGTYPFLDAVYPTGDWNAAQQDGTQKAIGGKADYEKTLKNMDELWDSSVKAAK